MVYLILFGLSSLIAFALLMLMGHNFRSSVTLSVLIGLLLSSYAFAEAAFEEESDDLARKATPQEERGNDYVLTRFY
jgi:hypothetical protein